ncbi:hypothetical protein [Elioraea sp.]|uniref:hypothetical protein n=1 Tax=Elioraea sp. TaxID=2185103 RepID=UPI0025C44CFA|nr:hypothetical protein [Elioraea sp.]
MMRASPRSGRRAGRVGTFTPPPGGDALIETVTLDNFSGAARTDPYITFARDFEAGDVPSGSRVEIRYAGSAIALQQADGRVLHADGSLRRAIFSCKPAAGSVADNAAIDLALWKVSGSFSNSTSIARSTLTAQDYKVRVRIGGVNYFCLLDNCDAAGNYREIRAGGAVRAWKHWGVLRNGEGGSDTDHGQLQARFYSYVWSDNTITVWAEVINGRVSNGEAYTVDEIELLNGVTSLQLYTTDFTFYHHTCVALVGADGLPVWSANATHFQPRASALYLHEKKLEWNIFSTSTQRAGIGSGTALNYSPNAVGDLGTINAGGASAWIGVIPTWSAFALLSGDKTRWRNDRVNALAQNCKNPGWYIRAETGEPPVLTNTDYTGAGLTSPQTTVGWGSGATITNTGSSVGGSSTSDPVDWSHRPHYSALQWMVTGWEWWLDRLIQLSVSALGGSTPSAATFARNPLINSNQYYGANFNRDTSREHGWAMHTCGLIDWTIPDNHVCAAYMREINSVSWQVVTEKMTAPFEQSGTWNHTTADAMGIYLGTEGTASGIAVAPWMQNYRALAIMQALNRGQISGSHKAVLHVERWCLGLLNSCPYHAMGLDRVAIRAGFQPTNSAALAANFGEVYGGGDGGSASQYTGTQVKVISDNAGSSGTCPTSGQNNIAGTFEAYAAGHTRPTINQCVAEVAHGLAITGGTSGRSYMSTHETGLSLAETAWNAAPQWRIRWPA